MPEVGAKNLQRMPRKRQMQIANQKMRKKIKVVHISHGCSLAAQTFASDKIAPATPYPHPPHRPFPTHLAVPK